VQASEGVRVSRGLHGAGTLSRWCARAVRQLVRAVPASPRRRIALHVIHIHQNAAITAIP
jgi:hypothetical protein